MVTWLLIQSAATVFPTLSMPGWSVKLVVLLALLGFAAALVQAWAYGATPTGLVRTEAPAAAEPQTPAPARISLATPSVA